MKWKQDRFRVSLDEITRSVNGKFNYISVNFDRTQHVFYGFMLYKLKSEDIFTRLIRLTLFMSCFVTYTCHGFPYDKPNALE